MTEPATRDGLLDRVRQVVPLVAQRAASAERERKPDDEVIEALKRSGVFRAFVPERFGGYEIDLELFVDIGIAVSEACASTGWITTFYMEHNWLLGLFTDAVQDEVFTAQPFILAPGTVNPNGGMAAPCDGGYALSGHWRFATGVVHADWILLNTNVQMADKTRTRLCLVRPDDVEVRDTWFVDGMAATGSRDIVCNEVFVPERFVAPSVPPALALGDSAPWLQRLPVRPFLALTAAIPAVGAARRSVELFLALLGKRVRYGSRDVQGKSVAAQMRLARVVADVRAAETVLRAIANDLELHARGKRLLSPVEQAERHLVIATVVHECARIVRAVMEGSGASAHFLDQELQRIARDAQMMAAHTVFDLDSAAEQSGRARLESATPLYTGIRPDSPASE